MIKTKISILLTVVVVVALLSSSKKDTTEQLYSAQIKSISAMNQVDGTPVSSDSLKGKMLILNFWASYDATSRINNFELLKLSDEYRNVSFYNGEGLSVVSISLDKFKAPLRKAIATDGTDCFSHICDYKGVDSELALSFDVNRPVNLLVDADGKIVARDFNVGTLRSALQMMTCDTCN